MIFHSFLKISSFHFILLLAMPVTQKKQSCLFLSFLFPSLLLLTPKSVQLFGEETWKVAKLPTITPAPVWKKLLLIPFPKYHTNYLHIHKGPGSTVISRGSANLGFFFNDRVMVAVYTH